MHASQYTPFSATCLCCGEQLPFGLSFGTCQALPQDSALHTVSIFLMLVLFLPEPELGSGEK